MSALEAHPSPPARSASPRGEFVDIGARRLRIVRAGPVDGVRPLVVLEHGAFGCATDWQVVQDRLAAKGLSSLAYDRAGLGHSDPGPSPRDGRAIAGDLAALLAALGETGPVVLVGHSMGGLMVRVFALGHPKRVLGLVLVDAVTPEVMASPVGAQAVKAFTRILHVATHTARLGLHRPLAVVAGDRIRLDRAASAEKRRIWGSPSHARGASAEVDEWPATSDQAKAKELPARTPVAVITAGGAETATVLKEIQMIPAIASKSGYIEHVPGAGHASLLGLRHADPIVRGVEHVLASVGR